jgi:PPOX class probable F420-dependent enzyme
MAAKSEQELLALIKSAYFVWFTTVRDDGMPQPTPVWFVPEQDSFLIYTTPDSHKLRNLKHNKKVALGYAGDLEANSYVVLMGEAAIDPQALPPNQNQAYMQKYGEGIRGINMTPDSFTRQFTVGIRVKSLHLRGE